MGNQCFVHMAIDPSSSSHCANDKQLEFDFILCHGNQLEFMFTPMMRKINKRLPCNVSQVKFKFLMFVSSWFAHVLKGNLNI